MRSTIVILDTSRSGLGQSLTLIGYSSGLPDIDKYRGIKSDSQSQQLYNPY